MHPGVLAMPELGPVRVLVAGEVILDRYLHGDVSRISPEAPIPVLRVTRREEKPGNAGFVMANLRALGAEVSAASIVGGDRDGALLREIFGGLGIGMRAMLTDPGRPTTVKARLLGSVQSANRATQQLLRVDEEETRPVSPSIERELIARMRRELARVHGVLISDINKGLLTTNLLRATIDSARKRKIPVIVDPRLTEDFHLSRRDRDNAQSVRDRNRDRHQDDRSRCVAQSWRVADQEARTERLPHHA
jgi:D-beta-D-heptose 7-phosphate kinase/D-beta-D-heptose 1-phosphate adenosyltransferase